MKLANEKILREGYADGVIVQERQYNNKVYCVTHINFNTSNPIHDTFENVCKQYNVDMALVETIKQKENIKMNENRTFSVETMTTPATDKQISTIISINTKYNIKGIDYPETTFFSKAHAIMMLEELFKAIETAERRPYDRDMYYKLYDRFSAKYPNNAMQVPVRDYRVDTEAIPDNTPPVVNKGLPDAKTIKHNVAEKAFINSVMNDMLTID